MADIRIKDLATTATTTASDDFMAVDGATNGTRKLSAATPAFLTSVTTPSLTSPAATNLTLAGGAGNSSIILTPAGTGGVGIGTVTPATALNVVLSAVDTSSGNIRLSTLNNDSSGISWYNRSTSTDANSRSWQIASNYNSSGTFEVLRSTTNLNAPTTNVMTFDRTGTVSIASATAGSSGAGALVVSGGLATGAASYIGGNLTIAGGTVNVLTPAPSTNSDNGPLYFYNSTTATGAYAAIKPFTGAYGDQVGIKFVTTLSTQTTALTLAPSGAATFAGAVTVSGNTIIGTTSTINNARITAQFQSSSGNTGISLVDAQANNTASFVSFYSNVTAIGSITNNNNTATSYNTSSDYRLKNSIAPMTGALATVALLKPVTYKWISNGSDGQGFIAHELAEVAPYAVTGEKDGERMQGVDYGKITPLLAAALQEAATKIKSLEARLVALEAK